MGCSSLTCSTMVLTLTLTLTLTSLGHLPITARADPGVVQARFTSQDRQCPGRVVSQDSCPVAMTAARVTRCASFCGRREWCLSWLLDANSGLCHLCEVTASSDCSNTVERTAGRRGWDLVMHYLLHWFSVLHIGWLLSIVTASLASWLRRPSRERKIPGSNPACTGIFSGSSHTSDLNIDTPVATLPGAWCYRVSAGAVWPGVSIM